MIGLLALVLIVSTGSAVLTGLFIAHELGWFPHGKDRSRPAERAFDGRSRHERDVQVTHEFQVMDPNTHILRAYGHAEIYDVKDPYKTLELIIERYREQPTRGRLDDLVHVPNYICNHVACDERVNGLIARIDALIDAPPAKAQ